MLTGAGVADRGPTFKARSSAGFFSRVGPAQVVSSSIHINSYSVGIRMYVCMYYYYRIH